MRGVDLRGVFTGDISWRRLRLLLDRLPIESEFKTELRNNTDLASLPPADPRVHGSWPQTDVLLASIYDRLGDLIYAQGGYERVPPPLPRPGVATVTPISTAASAYLEYKRTHQGADPPDDWTPEVG